MITFNGRDLVAHFKEDPNNTAVRQYRIEYQCRNTTVTHYVKAEDNQGNDPQGARLYRDVLTYGENEAAGLTRTPTVTFYAQNANLLWSAGRVIEAQNPIPVLSEAPHITSTLTGVEVACVVPADTDYEGFVAWVGTTSDVPLDAAHERYRGKASAFSLQLPDDDTYYLRVCPTDAFGIDTFSAWDAQPIKRGSLNDAIAGTEVVSSFAEAQAAIQREVGEAKGDAADAKQQVADARVELGQAAADAQTAANQAKQDAASVRTDLAPKVDAAKLAADKANSDLDAEITRAKGAEGTITTRVEAAQRTADGAVTSISTETTQRVDGDKLLSERIDTVESTATTDKG